MKQKLRTNSNGFTIIELLVVLSIMGLMGTMLIVNFNSTRNRRNLTLTSNELVTNIRKTQSYALSARDVSPNIPAKYYVLQFELAADPSHYKILAVDNNYTATPTLVETVSLPSDVIFDVENSSLVQPITGGNTTNPTCLQILFGLPFGRIYMFGSQTKSCDNSFIQTTKNPSAMAELTNSLARLYIRTMVDTGEAKGNPTYYNKTIEINGLSGTVSVQ